MKEKTELADKRISLAGYIKQLRISHGYTQQFVSDNLKVVRQTYSHYETGRISPPISVMCDLAVFYNIEPKCFFEVAVKENGINFDTNESGDSDNETEAYNSVLISMTDRLSEEQRSGLIKLLHSFVDE